MACTDFGREVADEGGELVDDVTQACFVEAMSGELEAVGFRTEVGFDGVQVQGPLWGGNLTVLMSLLGTPHWPRIKGGVLFPGDANEQPYRVERTAAATAPGRRCCQRRRRCRWGTFKYLLRPFKLIPKIATEVAAPTHLRSTASRRRLCGGPAGGRERVRRPIKPASCTSRIRPLPRTNRATTVITR
jgi:hypothetical protein